MNALDLVIMAILAIILIRSYVRGLLREVAAFGGLILALLVGIRFHPEAETFLVAAFGETSYMSAVAFGILFVATIMLVALISGRLSRIVTSGSLGGVDRLLGLVIGALKGSLIVIIGVFLLTFMAGPSHPLVANSRLAPEALEAAEWILDNLPERLGKTLAEKRAQLDSYRPGQGQKNQ